MARPSIRSSPSQSATLARRRDSAEFESPLDDAVPAEQREELVTELYTEQSTSDGDGGCRKCGHPEAEVETVETTRVPVTALIASQQNRLRRPAGSERTVEPATRV